MKISNRVARMSPSATAEMAAKALEKKKRGLHVVSFTTGEPDYDSPSSAQDYAFRAIKDGKTHYPPTQGIPELRRAAAEYYREHFGLSYESNEVVVGTGAKQLIYSALGCLIDPGDEVLILSPAWVSYVEQIGLFDGVPVKVDTSDTDYIPDLVRIENARTPRTRAIIINSPNNPTGVVYTSETLRAIGKLAKARNIFIINDEVYERLVYSEGTSPQILKECPDLRDQVLNVNGVSKSFAMTGWRIGYALGPAELIKAISDIQGHVTSGASSISQWASVGALTGGQEDCEKMRVGFEARRNLIVDLLSEIPGVGFRRPNGAFYVFVDIRGFLRPNVPSLADDVAFCLELLDKKNVGMVPGSAFLCPGYVRISYSCSEADIREGVKRFAEFVSEVTKG
ncbi:aminotransferase [Synergistales bacterium]|nr:aminotransferase [Synergistales bacterium]